VARHLEVQVVGDGTGAVVHLGERDCSLQRRHQKLVEIAPAPALSPFVRERLLAAAVRMAEEVRFDNVGTFEFLVDATRPGHDEADLAFLEANPRLQVEHTVTEEVTGVDLVQAQLRLAAGARLPELGLVPHAVPEPRGVAVQVRVNLERVQPDGSVRPSSGTITVFEPPSGPGVRVDTFATAGYRTVGSYDALLAKVVAHTPSPDPAAALRRVVRALSELRVEGVATNATFLAELAAHPDVAAGLATTTFVDDHGPALAQAAAERDPGAVAGNGGGRRAGASVDASDPLAVLEHGKRGRELAPVRRSNPPAAGDAEAVVAPLQGTVVSVEVAEGDEVPAGFALVVLEAMKMQHEVRAPAPGVVHGVAVAVGDTVPEDEPLLWLRRDAAAGETAGVEEDLDLDRIRPDLAEVVERHAVGLDERRPAAVAKRRATGQRTARENIADLVDPGSFVEYGPLTLAAQRRRRSVQELIEKTPADGLVGGLATVNADLVGEERAACVVATYDYTVLAGTQGGQNHRKKDRLFELAEKHGLPVVLFAEGGGGRPGDTDGLGVAGLDCLAFHLFGRLSGHVPLVGIVSGFCFAGNAALLGSCDVIIATERSYIGMGGPAMIEGGGLGVYRPEEVGPLEDQVPNGVVDLVVPDEAAAVAVAKQYLSYVQGPVAGWDCADQRVLRHLIPENRLRVYDVRRVIHALFDTGSVLELRRAFGRGMVTALARVEGRPVAVVANDPTHLGGAIDAAAAEKATDFLRRCESYGLPVVFLCDTPGFMVGPEAEREGLVRRAGELFGVSANLTVPYLTVVLRKGYGLGAQAMAGGSFKAPVFTISWPTGEFGGMGLEGAVKLGYRNELAAVTDPDERRALFDEMVARMYEHGKAVSMASHFEIDGVIDPAETRRWILAALRSTGSPGSPAFPTGM
jgi:acetyl-CoA carboxylase carboxyltransferase component